MPPAPAWTAPRRQAGQGNGGQRGSAAPRQPRGSLDGEAGGGWPLPRRWAPRTGGGALRPSAGDGALPPASTSFQRGARSLSAPPFCPSRSLLSLLHGAGGERVAAEGRGGPRGTGAGGRAAGAGSSPRPPEPGPPRGRCRCYRPALPGRGEKLSGDVGVTPLSPASAPVSAGAPGWLLAAARAAAGLLGLLALLSLSLSSPVVLCLSTTFRPAHYNAGERRSQDKDLKGWWVEKQGSKGGYALISRIRAVIS